MLFSRWRFVHVRPTLMGENRNPFVVRGVKATIVYEGYIRKLLIKKGVLIQYSKFHGTLSLRPL